MKRAILSGKGRRWSERHPWIYADDVASVDGERGDLVPVFGPNENALGWALFSTHSRITLRMVTRSAEQPNRAFWAERVGRAVKLRERLGYLAPDGACRLIAGDADGLPGLVIDLYAGVAVIQSGCQGSDRMRDFLLELVEEALPFPLSAVLDRSDASVRRLEDLEPRTEWLRGTAPDLIEVREGDLQYVVDVQNGHKTGHYLDQRENRKRAAATIGSGARVLDAFSYDGLFGVRAALAGAAEVICIDQNAGALERARANAERNGVSDRMSFERVNAMQDLRKLGGDGERFDLVVCDPPAFARNRKEAEGAGRGYRELNARAFALLNDGGHLVSASCSYAVRREEFLGFLADAAREAQREAVLEEVSGAALDHPHRIDLPETGYLKCAVLRAGGSPE